MAWSGPTTARVDDGGSLADTAPAPQIVGVVLVRNDDLFVERGIRNVAAFCDRVHAFDHVSTDGTWDILRSLEREYDHLDAQRTRHAGDSHRVRAELLSGTFDHAFKVASNVLNCVEIDPKRQTATGYLSPPSRSITKLYNFAAIDAWVGDGSERLHGGTIAFRPGYGDHSVENISERLSWSETPLRCLHVCFVRRSSLDRGAIVRPILMESGMHDRSWRGALKRRLLGRRPPAESTWKREKYMRGELVTLDAAPFLDAAR